MNILRITRRVLTVVLVAGSAVRARRCGGAVRGALPQPRRPGDVGRPAGERAGRKQRAVRWPRHRTRRGVAHCAPSGGFDWGDATIGAAAMLAITAIAAGGAVELSRRRRPRPTVA